MFVIFQISVVQLRAAEPRAAAARNTAAVTVTCVSSVLWLLAQFILPHADMQASSGRRCCDECGSPERPCGRTPV